METQTETIWQQAEYTAEAPYSSDFDYTLSSRLQADLGEDADAARAEQAEQDVEFTAGDVYDDLHERAALARTRALMGERAEALDILERARAEYAEYRHILEGLPLASLEHAFEVTMGLLCDEQAVQQDALPVLVTTPDLAEHKPRTRKRVRKAA